MATPARRAIRLVEQEQEKAEPAGEELVRVYVWQRPVRITHWTIAFSIAVLAGTGLYIGHPFVSAPGTGRFVMGWMKTIHVLAAIPFTAALVARMIWMFTGNRFARWDQFIPVSRVRQKASVQSFLFYIWMLRKPPGVIGHNPLAGSAYLAIFGLEAVMVLTGLAIYGASADTRSVLHVFAGLAPWLGGLMWVRWIHHVVMWLLLGFVVQHVYSSILVSVVERNATLDSIISGMKVFKEKDLIEPIPPESREGEPP